VEGERKAARAPHTRDTNNNHKINTKLQKYKYDINNGRVRRIIKEGGCASFFALRSYIESRLFFSLDVLFFNLKSCTSWCSVLEDSKQIKLRSAWANSHYYFRFKSQQTTYSSAHLMPPFFNIIYITCTVLQNMGPTFITANALTL
jgi:hypothetical protein